MWPNVAEPVTETDAPMNTRMPVIILPDDAEFQGKGELEPKEELSDEEKNSSRDKPLLKSIKEFLNPEKDADIGKESVGEDTIEAGIGAGTIIIGILICVILI